METVQNTLQVHRADLLQLPNVVGVGVGERAGQTVIKVLVTHKVSSAELQPHERVPATLGAFRCDVEEVGVLQAGAVQTEVPR